MATNTRTVRVVPGEVSETSLDQIESNSESAAVTKPRYIGRKWTWECLLSRNIETPAIDR
jgi:hypothetical protein